MLLLIRNVDDGLKKVIWRLQVTPQFFPLMGSFLEYPCCVNVPGQRAFRTLLVKKFKRIYGFEFVAIQFYNCMKKDEECAD